MGSCLSSATVDAYDEEKWSSDYGMEMRVHRVPGRYFLNGSSQLSSLFCKQGRKGINQDAMLLWENFSSTNGAVFCGVFDGHGPNGHKVAKKVRDSFPLKLMAQWKSSMPPNNFVTLRESFIKACRQMDTELKLHLQLDCSCSGTTAVTLLKHGHDIVIANVGDSRAVLATHDHRNASSLIAIQLTTDLKPDLPREAERIRMCKGRVFGLKNEPGVARLWLPNIDSPGLAMSRAFGDFCLKNFGLISVPDFSYHRLTHRDQFVVLATDGVWDVLSNQQVVSIVASAPRSCAAKVLVHSAVQAWKTNLPTSKVDDCSVVCLFFDSDSTSNSNSDSDSIHPNHLSPLLRLQPQQNPQ
ncbi:hypothetical protein VNO78_18710 [Psophocarpus tetragonolobus]|uniref:PPM-type phosphatase domain-containing protein n=1 Tax=Psophocarpus tetragonolobus TaxID=3891 RepID=A0AAN9XFU9_PSOTE